MSGYSKFALFYDELTMNVDYAHIAKRIDDLVEQFGGRKNIFLELGCGTGSLCEQMSRKGYDVIGVDISNEMLNVALDKKFDSGNNIQYLCQDMTELDMYGTIDVTVSVLDSINHLHDKNAVKKAFEKVSLFAYPDGMFIFDVNTKYKHREVLAENAFLYDLEDVFCAWQNQYNSDDDSVDIYLDFFEKQQDGKYERFRESFTEIALDESEIDSLLDETGFEILGKYDGYTEESVSEKTERIVYVTKKIKR